MQTKSCPRFVLHSFSVLKRSKPQRAELGIEQGTEIPPSASTWFVLEFAKSGITAIHITSRMAVNLVGVENCVHNEKIVLEFFKAHPDSLMHSSFLSIAKYFSKDYLPHQNSFLAFCNCIEFLCF